MAESHTHTQNESIYHLRIEKKRIFVQVKMFGDRTTFNMFEYLYVYIGYNVDIEVK